MTDYCPECGIDLTTKSKTDHAYSHWGILEKDVNVLGPEARKRYLQLVGKNGGD